MRHRAPEPVHGARPTPTAFWRGAIHKALRAFPRVVPATYALPGWAA